MSNVATYKTEPLRCWDDYLRIRSKFYEDYVKAHERGGIRYCGSSSSPHALVRGLGRDVYHLAGEPYGANIAFHKDFATQCEEASEKKGIARDLCSYLRNYWGSVFIDKFILPDGTVLNEFPKSDFAFGQHICCSHLKWYQFVSELEGNIPVHGIDMGPRVGEPISKASINYLVAQLEETIEWLEKTRGNVPFQSP